MTVTIRIGMKKRAVGYRVPSAISERSCRHNTHEYQRARRQKAIHIIVEYHNQNRQTGMNHRLCISINLLLESWINIIPLYNPIEDAIAHTKPICCIPIPGRVSKNAAKAPPISETTIIVPALRLSNIPLTNPSNINRANRINAAIHPPNAKAVRIYQGRVNLPCSASNTAFGLR